VSSFFARVCRDAHLPRPCRAEGGRTAPMTMPFGYVGIEHVSIRFTVHHARAPLGSWSTWSPRLVKTHFIFSSLASARRHVPTTLQPDAQPAVNQGRSLLCCASRPSYPCSSWFVVRACQHRTTISVAITHTHIHSWRLLSYRHPADLERFSFCGAPVPRPHHPFVVPLSVHRERRVMMATLTLALRLDVVSCCWSRSRAHKLGLL